MWFVELLVNPMVARSELLNPLSESQESTHFGTQIGGTGVSPLPGGRVVP